MTSQIADSPINYSLHGFDLQMLKVSLMPGQTLIAEKGAMAFMEDGLTFEAKLTDGSEQSKGLLGTIASGLKRKLSGENLWMIHLTNAAETPRSVGISVPYAGQIQPVRVAPGRDIICQRGAFIAATKGVHISFLVLDSPSGGFFGGEGLVMQVLRGEGLAFIHGGGAIVEHQLQDSALHVDTGSLIGFTEGIDFSARPVGRVTEIMVGGEGIFISRLKGTGTVWIQSLPFARQCEQQFRGMERQIGAIVKNLNKK